MTKFLGIILASIFSVILIVQIEQQVRAQVADSPLTGPITSPITSPLTSPTDSPTPTLINTLTSTPTVTVTTTPTVTLTTSPIPSATPTPLPANVVRLGGLNLDGYCGAVGNNWDTVINGQWYCGNGSAKIDMTSACQWQNNRTDTFAFQDRAGDVYSWSCYAATPNVTPTVAMTVTPTVTPTVSVTITPTPSIVVTPTPSDVVTVTPTVTSEITVTPSVGSEPTVTPTPSHNHKNFFFHGFSLRAILNAIRLLESRSQVSMSHDGNSLQSEICTIHDTQKNSASHSDIHTIW